MLSELCLGGSLADILKANKTNEVTMSEDDARKYICEIIVALEFVHK